MSLEALTWALSSDVGNATRKLVLIGLANHAHRDGRNAYASWRTIAQYVGCAPRTVKRQLEELEAAGFVRRGDQRQVEHIRGDRRPVVYDLAMGTTRRRNWEAAAAAETTPGAPDARHDDLSPRDDDAPESPKPVETDPRGDTALSPRPTGHGVTNSAPRGDKAVSPEPSTEPTTPPQPPVPGGASHGGATPSAAAPQPAFQPDPQADLDYDPNGPVGPVRCCTKHPEEPSQVDCRGCRTTPRQVEAWSKHLHARAKREARAAKVRAEVEESQRRRQQITTDVAVTGAARARQSLPSQNRRVRTRG